MCLYIQNQNFEKYTENMLNRLAEGAGLAREQLAAVAKSTGALGRDTAALQRKAEDALGLLRQHSELEEVRGPHWWRGGLAHVEVYWLRCACMLCKLFTWRRGCLPGLPALQESLRLQKKARAEMQSYYLSLDAKQQAALEAQVRMERHCIVAAIGSTAGCGCGQHQR